MRTTVWVGTGVLNFGPSAQWSRWWSVAEIFGRRSTSASRPSAKPVMIAEFGSLAGAGPRRVVPLALASMPVKYPASSRAGVLSRRARHQTVTYQKVDWTFTSIRW
jgi:hypothetical protein